MFEINDDFLKNIGYDVDNLTESQKDEYKAEFTQDFSERLIERFSDELTPEQSEEFMDIQNNPTRTRRWLDEFHADYRERAEFKQLVAAGSDDEAMTFYATALWLRDAIPGYGEVIQSELNEYQIEMVELRATAYDAIDGK